MMMKERMNCLLGCDKRDEWDIDFPPSEVTLPLYDATNGELKRKGADGSRHSKLISTMN